MRWPWQRPSAPHASAPSLSTPAFDALIDLDPSQGPACLDRVAHAVRALPGATWINVELHPAPEGLAVRVFPAGESAPRPEPVWTTIQARVMAAAAAVLPAAAQPGFAEARAPNPMEALEQLAALARATMSSPLPAPKPPAPARPSAPSPEPLVRLLAFVLQQDPRPVAAVAIRRFGSYAAVLAAPEAELRTVAGLGTQSVAAIKLMQAAAVRLARARVARQPILSDRTSLADYLAAALSRARIEQFRILFLDAADMLIADEVQATGTVNHTPVYPREVVRRAIELGAAALVLVHNHPSGDPAPSPEDLRMTRQVERAALALSLVVRDHVIVGNGRWLSFREAGLLD